MTGLEVVRKLSEKYSMTLDDFLKTGSCSMLREKKLNSQVERLEILSRYGVTGIDALKEKIEKSEIPEHPGWEDLIELRNIEAQIKEIDSDIRYLQTA